MRKLKVTSGLSREISFIAILWNPEPNWSTSTLPEPLIASLDILLEKHIDDCWNVDEERGIIRCMNWLHKIYFIECKATWRIHMVREETCEEIDNLSCRQSVARDVEAYVWCIKTQSEAKVGHRETKARKCQTNTWYLLHWSWRRGIQAYYERCSKKVGTSGASSKMPCKTPANCSGETCRNVGKQKTNYACIVDADESMRIRLEGVPRRYHEDHIAAKGVNSLSHCH